MPTPLTLRVLTVNIAIKTILSLYCLFSPKEWQTQPLCVCLYFTNQVAPHSAGGFDLLLSSLPVLTQCDCIKRRLDAICWFLYRDNCSLVGIM